MGTVLDLNFQNVDEIKTLGADTEVKLRVDSIEIKPRKKDASIDQAVIKFVDPSDPLVDDIYVYLRIPTDAFRNEEPKAYAKLMIRWQKFYDCFDIDTSGPVQTDDIPGSEGWCLIGVENDNEGEPRNRINKFVAGK